MYKNIFAALVVCLALGCSNGNNKDPLKDFLPYAPPAHDPAVAFCDSLWYLYSTGFGINIFSSADQKNWTYVGKVFDEAPAWAVESVPKYKGHTWAPDISFHNGLYYLYYSCSSFGKNDSAIGVATNPTLNPDSPDYLWTDHGCVVRSAGGENDYNAIDPNLFVDDDGTPWLSFGSFWSGVKMVQLDSTLTAVAGDVFAICHRPEETVEDISKTDDAIKPDPRGKAYDPGNGAVEAPYIIKRNGEYFLFVSYDLCCRGSKSTYKVVVGRSDRVTGPYTDKEGRFLLDGGGTLVLRGNERYPGVGHCAIVRTPDGDRMFFHGYDKTIKYNATLLVRPVVWTEDGWPEVTL